MKPSTFFSLLAGVLVVALVTAIVMPIIEPTSEERCVLKHLDNMQTDSAVSVLVNTCRRRFEPPAKAEPSQDNPFLR